ncbi:iron-containing alcohol dehydrogenase [Lachnoclostridium sp. Marseille-P6806]|uniref:iron-containing alcohol dehydrogenase n=1 Tax=Lachnoclostridium sp. Marseille-P6806 TaxID=2364793 RepID=UPI0013EF29ED|nr:iron-containing alcohol dehydrogenase [Lachnoclostridium sp. Marseille-P6806]
MMKLEDVSALKVGCGQYFGGEGVIDLLAPTIRRLGGKALMIGGVKGSAIVMNAAEGSLISAEISHKLIVHTGECTKACAGRYAREALRDGCTTIVGMGGGKCIDLAKAVSVLSGLPVVTVPTSIATCVPTSMVCIMYNDKGQRRPAINMQKEVDVCIADDNLIATAPPRLFASGILDSIAKLGECGHQKKVLSYKDCTTREYIQLVNSKALCEFLYGEGRDVYANRQKAARFTECILTNLLHTSIVSGFADGSGQLALAHATYDFMRTENTEKAARWLHGELVAVGLLLQLAFNGDSDEEIDVTRRLMKDMNMPTTLAEIGYDTSEESLALYLNSIAEAGNVITEGGKAKLKEAVKQIL